MNVESEILAEDPEELHNVDPPFVLNFVNGVTEFFANNGWYILVITIAALYAYSKARPSIEKYLKRKDDDEYAAKYHKNPDLYRQRFQAMELARQKMQENQNKFSKEHEIKLKEREDRKKRELLEKYSDDKLGGHKLGNGSDKKAFKTEYNPLMGNGSGSSYRAPKRSPCGSGGCGK